MAGTGLVTGELFPYQVALSTDYAPPGLQWRRTPRNVVRRMFPASTAMTWPYVGSHVFVPGASASGFALVGTENPGENESSARI